MARFSNPILSSFPVHYKVRQSQPEKDLMWLNLQYDYGRWVEEGLESPGTPYFECLPANPPAEEVYFWGKTKTDTFEAVGACLAFIRQGTKQERPRRTSRPAVCNPLQPNKHKPHWLEDTFGSPSVGYDQDDGFHILANSLGGPLCGIPAATYALYGASTELHF